MKKILAIFTLLLTISMGALAQESAKPLTDQEVVRKVAIMDIEGTIYKDVVVTMKSTSPDYFITDHYKVKVSVTDSTGKKVWKKTLKNVFLYVFSDGQIQIGKRNFDQIVIQKSSYTGDFIGTVREKEGIF